MHIANAKGYQGYKSNFGCRLPFDREPGKSQIKTPFLDSPKGTHPLKEGKINGGFDRFLRSCKSSF